MSIINLTFTPGEEKPLDIAFRYFLILSDGGTPFDVYMRSAQGVAEPLTSIQSGFALENAVEQQTQFRIFSSVAQTIQIYYGNNKATFNRFSGNVNIAGNLAGITNQVAVRNDGDFYGASYKSITPQAANTPDTVFSPGANVNGAIVYDARFFTYHASAWNTSGFLAKVSAPANVVDGDVIVSADIGGNLSTSPLLGGSLKNPIKIPAGKGLYYIPTLAENTSQRSVLYKLL